eukprot:NODE_148_length_17471_cov_0.413136.p12 type:complete len:144 gc:universal NODE_148_length_17471_cov_0.413136:3201-3632(+)
MTEMREVPAKRPVPVARVQNKKKARDPRFDSFRPFDFHQFSNNYAFLKEQSSAELSLLREKLKEGPNEDLEIKLQSLLTKRKNRIELEKETALKRKVKKEEIAKVLQGKKPFYQKNIELERPKGKNKRRSKYRKKEEIPLGLS